MDASITSYFTLLSDVLVQCGGVGVMIQVGNIW